MAIFATEANRFSHVVANEYAPETGYNRDVVVYNGAAADLVPGTVLGKATLDTTYGIFADGDDDVVVVLEEKTAAATTDTPVLVLVRSPADVKESGLIVAAGQDASLVVAALEAKGIRVLPAV